MRADRLLVLVLLTVGASLVAVVLYLLYLAGGFPLQLFLALTLFVLAGGFFATLIAKRGGRVAASGTSGQAPSVHPGITMHAIPVGGAMGAVFAVGYVVMFWFGVPGYRPVLFTLGTVGVLFGGLLVVAGQRRAASRERDRKVLHIEQEQHARRPVR